MSTVHHAAHGGGVAIGKLAKKCVEIDLTGYAASRAFEPQVDKAVTSLRRWAAANRGRIATGTV